MKRAMLLFALAACGGGGGTADDEPVPDAPAGGDARADADPGCPREPGPADAARHVVIAHPYDASGGQADTWEVVDLSATGELSRPSPRRTFEMGRAPFGQVVFTPDGEVGLVAQNDGSVGVFRLDAGVPTVVHARFEGTFYASRIVVDPRGDRAWILDGNWRKNGGGVYEVGIGCDGALAERGMVAPSKLAAAMALTGGRAVIAATDLLTSTAGDDVHLVTWDGTPADPTLIDGVDAFGDDEAIVGGAALTADGATFLVGDTSQFSGVPNRVAVVGVTATGVTSQTVVTPVEDPAAIATSPFGDVAVVASAFGDALFVLDRGGPSGAWRVRGEVAYQGGRPQLPADLAPIDRGALRGHVLVAENVKIRHLAFQAGGQVEDLGSLGFGSGLDQIVGAIGVTP